MTKRKEIPSTVDMEIPGRQYQPSRVEMREEMGMPGLSMERICALSMRPFRFKNPPANCD